MTRASTGIMSFLVAGRSTSLVGPSSFGLRPLVARCHHVLRQQYITLPKLTPALSLEDRRCSCFLKTTLFCREGLVQGTLALPETYKIFPSGTRLQRDGFATILHAESSGTSGRSEIRNDRRVSKSGHGQVGSYQPKSAASRQSDTGPKSKTIRRYRDPDSAVRADQSSGKLEGRSRGSPAFRSEVTPSKRHARGEHVLVTS